MSADEKDHSPNWLARDIAASRWVAKYRGNSRQRRIQRRATQRHTWHIPQNLCDYVVPFRQHENMGFLLPTLPLPKDRS